METKATAPAGAGPAGPGEEARQRSGVYGILSQVFLKEMSPTLLATLRTPKFASALADLDLDPATALGRAPDERIVEALAVQYTGLFLGPGPHVPPYESVYAGPDTGNGRGSLCGEPAVQMRRLAEEEGLKITPPLASIPDHLAVELEYMQRLASLEADRWLAGDRNGVAAARDKQRAFLDEHLGRWLPAFVLRVVEAAGSSFYGKMAILTAKFAAEDRKFLDEPVN